MRSFDYIVVGSGSSGGVIAARLSESGKFSVLCLEAGTRNENFIWSRSPLGGAFMIHDNRVNWNEFSEPDESHGNRPLHVPHGKILGGSSSINATISFHGQPSDYDHWAQLGCRGWAAADVLPLFKKIERTEIGDETVRGREGKVNITPAAKLSPFYDVLMDSCEAAGIPRNPDYNSTTQFGVSMSQLAARRGKRNSTATQYLAPARGRSNLTIASGAEAQSLIFEGKRCVGVRYRVKGRIKEARAGREVIVSAGSINSPKLLELSGIGDPDLLKSRGIVPIHALPNVGEHLLDHYAVPVKFLLNRPGLSLNQLGHGWRFGRELLRYVLLGQGLMSQGLASIQINARSNPGVEDADIQMSANPYLVEIPGGNGISGTHGRREMSRLNGFYMWMNPHRPESTGSVHIKGNDPHASPTIRFKSLATEYDQRVMIAAVRIARTIAHTAPLGTWIERELEPSAGAETDDEIIAFARNFGNTSYHPVGTCRMGGDDASVVDERLRVRGVAGLRVADGSIMPTLTSGNTSLPCMMIGEKAAAMILADAGRIELARAA